MLERKKGRAPVEDAFATFKFFFLLMNLKFPFYTNLQKDGIISTFLPLPSISAKTIDTRS